MKNKIIRITTVPQSLGGLLKGQLKYFSKYFETLAISSEGEGDLSLDSYGKIENTRIIPIEMTRKITPFKDLRAVWQLYKVLKREKPFIVHSHTPKAGTLGMLASYMARVPHRLHTIAGLPLLEATGSKRLLLDTVEKLTYFFATKIYPNSYGLKDIIVKNNYTKLAKLKVLANGSSNGIDIDHFDPNHYDEETKNKLKKDLNISSKDFVFLFVGRLVKDKGINELVETFDKLSKERENLKLLLVGSFENDLDPVLPNTKQLINTNTNILSIGWQTDVRPFIAISNALTFPSYREGFPNVVMQAGAMGLPAIVTDINGCNEIIIEEKNGTIIPVKNQGALYKKMLQFSNGELSYNSEVCRELIIKKYDRKVVWNAILKEYESLNNKK